MCMSADEHEVTIRLHMQQVPVVRLPAPEWVVSRSGQEDMLFAVDFVLWACNLRRCHGARRTQEPLLLFR